MPPERRAVVPLPTCLFALLLSLQAHAAAPEDRIGPADLARIAEVSEPEFSPDGEYLAYTVTTSNLEADRQQSDLWRVRYDGRGRVQLTHTTESDESRPSWSPDGKRIAHLQGGEDKWICYAPFQLAVTDVASGTTTLPAPIDRWIGKPHWAKDGRSLYMLVEQSRVTHLSRVSLANSRVTALTDGPRVDLDFTVAGDRVVVLGGGDHHPPELAAIEAGSLRPLTAHNEWLMAKRLAPVEDISFRSADGTVIDGFLVKPLDYIPGRRYPTILRIHGGPVYQFSHEFMPDWQAYAASGYVVVAANPRGSSGRGFDFARAIYADWGNKDVADVLAAVSGAGVSNVLGFYGHDMYVREYDLELGPPWRNREAWERLSYPFLHADRITTPTLFYCAERDFNQPCLGAEQMYQALRTQDVPTRLVIYPGENHELLVPSYLRDRLERLIGWYDRFLKP